MDLGYCSIRLNIWFASFRWRARSLFRLWQSAGHESTIDFQGSYQPPCALDSFGVFVYFGNLTPRGYTGVARFLALRFFAVTVEGWFETVLNAMASRHFRSEGSTSNFRSGEFLFVNRSKIRADKLHTVVWKSCLVCSILYKVSRNIFIALILNIEIVKKVRIQKDRFNCQVIRNLCQ